MGGLKIFDPFIQLGFCLLKTQCLHWFTPSFCYELFSCRSSWADFIMSCVGYVHFHFHRIPKSFTPPPGNWPWQCLAFSLFVLSKWWWRIPHPIYHHNPLMRCPIIHFGNFLGPIGLRWRTWNVQNLSNLQGCRHCRCRHGILVHFNSLIKLGRIPVISSIIRPFLFLLLIRTSLRVNVPNKILAHS